VPNLNHLWQRFLITSALLVGLAIGAAATVFGYSNLTSVDVHWSVFHVNGVPLWTVVVVPLAITLAAGTLYHWADGLHHFTEHMRHRHRVHELEAELSALRAHLDQVLEMPDHVSTPKPAAKAPLPVLDEREMPEPAAVATKPQLPAAEIFPEPVAPPHEPLPPARKSGGERRKRVRVTVASEPVGGANGKASSETSAAAKPSPEA
jgi:hypothetical protein